MTFALLALSLAAQAATVRGEGYTTTATPSGACQVGSTCKLSVSTETTGSARMHKPIVVSERKGSPPDLRSSEPRCSDTRCTATVSFTPDKAGRQNVTFTVQVTIGSQSFSDKLDLELDVDVK
jgi:hypothetical protein